MNFEINIENLKKQIIEFKNESNEMGKIINPILDNYDLEKKEILEVCQIGKFIYKIDSDIRIIDKPQPPDPDFIINFKNHFIGLEHTQIVTKNASKFFRIKNLLDYAEQIFKKKYPNVNIHGIIEVQNDELNFKQKEKPHLAEQIADFVEWTRRDLEFELPEFISRIRTTRHSQVSFSFKEKNSNAEYLTRDRLKQEIVKKESKIQGYKKSKSNLSEYWLVLLIGSLSSVSYELNETENYEMESMFDRVYLMADFDAKIIRIK